jgi:CGNR zinc finger/Putative stress-induced transcription regulator
MIPRFIVTGVYYFASHTLNVKGITGQVNFTSHIDVIVAAAVNLVNAVTPGEARGRTFEQPTGTELQEAVREALRGRRPVAPAISAADAARLAQLAGWLRSAFDSIERGDVDAAAITLNALLAETGARPQLDRHDGEPWHLHFHGRTETVAQGWGAGCATGLAVVLGTDMYDRLGVCTAPRCDRVYVDNSRNGTRRFCSTSCQNRVKAAAFRARQVTTG